jgi:glycine hydroxymethyltransferase
MKLNASGKYFNFVHYGVDENGYLDYEQLEKLAFEHKPAMIVA